MDDTLLFVYGTLRRGTGHPMAERLADAAQWLGSATIEGNLYLVHRYPALVATPGHAAVVGDLFRLNHAAISLAWLDVYEGCGPNDAEPHEYLRVTLPVTCGGRRLMAQTYVWNRLLDGLVAIEGGDWLRVASHRS